MPNSELEIIKLCQSGNRTEFAKLYDLYIKAIYRFLFYRTGHRETAEDLTSLTFLKALSKIDTYQEKQGKFSSWLYQIARNNLGDHFRQTKTVENLWEMPDLQSSANTEKNTDTALAMQKLKKYLAALPELPREIIILRVWDNLTHREIAEMLGLSEANAKMIFSRTLRKLQTEIIIALLPLLFLTK